MFARKLSIKESTPLKKPTAILQTKFLSRGMSSAMRSERQKKLSLLAGKLSIEKKSLRFWIVSSVEQKIYKSFGEKNLGNPPYAKKSKREPIFWLVTRPFSQRKISLFPLILNSRHKRDHIIWKHKFYLPLSLFTKYKYVLTSENVGKHNWTPKE